MTALKASLDDLENCLYGVYYGPNLKRDVLHPVTGEITSRATGEMTENLLPLDISTRARMRFYAAQNYFESITAPGSERWLTRYGDMTRGDSQGDMTVAKHSDAAKRARVEKHAKMHVGEPVLLPRVKEVCGKCACELGGEGGEVLDVESVKEMKREMKRRKNRLSAARSNQRRKEKVEAEKKELERLKVRREELAGVQKRLKEENELLKQQTGTAS